MRPYSRWLYIEPSLAVGVWQISSYYLLDVTTTECFSLAIFPYNLKGFPSFIYFRKHISIVLIIKLLTDKGFDFADCILRSGVVQVLGFVRAIYVVSP